MFHPPAMATTEIEGRFVVVHTITPNLGVNPNRDMDGGNPKSIWIGGVKRMRVSAQCANRSDREMFRQIWDPAAGRAMRTRFLPARVADTLRQRGVDDLTAHRAGMYASLAAGFKVDMGDPAVVGKEPQPPRTQVSLFVREDAPERISDVLAEMLDESGVQEHLKQIEDDVASYVKKFTEEGTKRRKGGKAKTGPEPEAKEWVLAPEKYRNPDLEKRVRHALAPGDSLEIALFGRMITEIPDADIPSAVQRGHSISADKMSITSDPFAVKEDVGSYGIFSRGSAMFVGTNDPGAIKLASATLYAFAALDRRQLRTNIRHAGIPDVEEMAVQAELDWVRCVAYSVPSGMLSRTGPTTIPTLVAGVVTDAQPTSLVGAFNSPVADQDEQDDRPVDVRASDRALSWMRRLHDSGMSPLNGGVARWLPPVDSPAPDLPKGVRWDGAPTDE